MYITILVKQVYWYISQVSGEHLQDHWSSGFAHGFLMMRLGTICAVPQVICKPSHQKSAVSSVLTALKYMILLIWLLIQTWFGGSRILHVWFTPLVHVLYKYQYLSFLQKKNQFCTADLSLYCCFLCFYLCLFVVVFFVLFFWGGEGGFVVVVVVFAHVKCRYMYSLE